MSSQDVRRPASLAWDVSSATCPDAFDRYHQSMADLYDVTAEPADNDRVFISRTTVTLFANGTVGRGFSVGQTMRRTPAAIRRAGLDVINIALNFSPLVGDCGGTDVRTEPGAVQFRDMARESASHLDSVDLINVMVLREAAPAWMCDGAMHGAVMRPDTAAGRLLAGHLVVLARTAPELSREQGAAAIEAAILIAGSGAGRLIDPTADQSEAVYRTVRHRATKIIERRLLDPTLTIQAIVDGTGASRTTVFRAFGPGGVRAHVQNLRLDRARAMLRRQDGRRRTVSEVAFSHGFASAAHFSRLFRARFGHPPTEIAMPEPEGIAANESGSSEMRHGVVVDWLRDRAARLAA
ncbi:helix-turn-helix domain-containing protein [Brevundimonas lenta]|uniref:AraC-like DNA-binding protein n=1 Tax=Brevundimonas lenta TaxID=424796 RepID=A0A7W6NPS0_9CAUL|nr:AraC-like DNA-binding protein [Brevundimonas lenta]